MPVGQLGPHSRVFNGRPAVDGHLLSQPEQGEEVPLGIPAADGHPLVHQGADGDFPALPHGAEPLCIRDTHIGEMHLVEVGIPGNLLDRPDLKAGGFHVEEEVGQPLMLGRIGIRAHHQDAVVRIMGTGSPDFLAVHQPAVAVPLRLGAQPGEIRTGARLAEQLAPDLLAAGQLGQVAPLVILRRPSHEGGCRHALADAENAARQVREPRFLLIPDHLLHGAGAAPAVCGRPADAGPARLVLALLP